MAGVAWALWADSRSGATETDVDSHSFKLKGEFNGHDGPVWALAVNKKRQMLISGSSDETIRVRPQRSSPPLVFSLH